MFDIDKPPTQEDKIRIRQEIHADFWTIAQNLRDNVPSWEYRTYLLDILFYRALSDDLLAYISTAMGDASFQYAELDDENAAIHYREKIRHALGYYIPPSAIFDKVAELSAHDTHLVDNLLTILHNIEASSVNFDNIFSDFDTSNSLIGPTRAWRNTRFTRLLVTVATLRLSTPADMTITPLSDAFDSLLEQYAAHNPTLGDDFATHPRLNAFLVRLVTAYNPTAHTVYDPACGSATLLLETQKNLAYAEAYGEEIDTTMYNLARINTYLHHVDFSQCHLYKRDTLLNSRAIQNAPFDIIVTNLPHHKRWVGNSNPDLLQDKRYAPAKILASQHNSEMAFVMHILSTLSPTGVAAVTLLAGALSRRGIELNFRRYLIDNNLLDTVISLPNTLMYNTQNTPCVLILRKNKTNNQIYFVNACNPDSSTDFDDTTIDKYVATCIAHMETPYSHAVDPDKIRAKAYDLIPTHYLPSEK